MGDPLRHRRHSNWWLGQKVLLPRQWVDAVRWDDRKVSVDVPRERIRQQPEWGPDGDIVRDYEERLYAHDGRSGYWQDGDR